MSSKGKMALRQTAGKAAKKTASVVPHKAARRARTKLAAAQAGFARPLGPVRKAEKPVVTTTGTTTDVNAATAVAAR